MNREPHSWMMTEPAPGGRERLMQKALPLFVEHGIAGTGIREIAAAAGVSNPALYKHFKGKDELAGALFVACYEHLSARLQQALQDHEGFQQQLQALVAEFATAIDDTPGSVIYVSDNLHRYWSHMPEDSRRRTIAGILRRLIQNAAAEGRLPPGVSPEMHLAAILGLMGHISRMIWQGAFKGPAQRWVPHMTALLECLFPESRYNS